MSEAVPANEAAAAGKKRPLLRRVPTSLVVTLVGIALTAWLLPALTRQWDDRQKAHELKAGIVNQMANASAQALFGGKDNLCARQPRQHDLACVVTVHERRGSNDDPTLGDI